MQKCGTILRLAQRLLHELRRPAPEDLRILALLKEMTRQAEDRPAWIEERGGITFLCMKGIPGSYIIEYVLLREAKGLPFYKRVGEDLKNVWYDLRVSLETYSRTAPKVGEGRKPEDYPAGEDWYRRDEKIYELVEEGWKNSDIAAELERLSPIENWLPVGEGHIRKRLTEYCGFTGKTKPKRKGGAPKKTR